MKKNLLFIALGIVLIASLAGCAPQTVEAGGGTPMQGGITVNGTGRVFLTPNVSYVTIGVKSQAEEVSTALSENNNKSEKVSQALIDLGIEVKDIQTTAFNVYPQDIYSNTGERTGQVYVVENSVFVTIRDLAKLGETLDTVVKAGANNIYGIQFDVRDKQAAVTQARKQAVESAKAQAQELADAAGVKLGKLQIISSYYNNYPQPVYEAKAMGGMAMDSASTPIAAGQLVISVDVSLTYDITQ